MPLTIAVAARPPEFADRVRTVVPDADVRVVDEDDLVQVTPEADVVATVRFPPAAVQAATRLKWVQSLAAGPDAILSDELRTHPAPLTCCRGNGAIPLAEYGIMAMLMLDRDVPRLLRSQAERKWDRFPHGELNGRTVGIIGAGYSGTDLAVKSKAFHMKVIGLRRRREPVSEFDETYHTGEIRKFLGQADFVVVTAALTEESRGMLGEAEFRAMKRTAYYVNYSRGGIADTDALVRALQEGWIAGAALDAHAVEPLPSTSPFWTMPNVIVTPHTGATSPATRERGDQIFLENLRRFVAGEPLVNPVDKDLGY